MTYDLLSDADSAVIREFGILNTLISPDDPEQVAGRSFYGVPFPGVYVTDENGVVTEKFFHRHYATRESAGAIRDSALGEILARHEVPAIELGTDQVQISAFLSDTSLKFETQSTLYVRFELEDGLHMWPAASRWVHRLRGDHIGHARAAGGGRAIPDDSPPGVPRAGGHAQRLRGGR